MPDTNSTDTRYAIAYSLEPLPGDGLTKAEMEAHPKYGDGNWGGTDKCVIASIMESPDGTTSTMIFSRQQDGSDLPAVEIYKLVVLLCRKLAMEGGLDGVKEHNCWAFFNAQLVSMGLNPQILANARKTFGAG